MFGPTSQIAQVVLEPGEMIFQDFRKNAMQAYKKYKKTYYDSKDNASKHKQAEYIYVLQPTADHQGSKIFFTGFWWIGTYMIEKVLQKNIYLVCKVVTNHQ